MAPTSWTLVLDSAAPGELAATVEASPDLIWCDGHFPGNPILPGVAFLDFVAESFAARFREPGSAPLRVNSFMRVRFKKIIHPPATLKLSARPAKNLVDSWVFDVKVDGIVACEGSLRTVADPG